MRRYSDPVQVRSAPAPEPLADGKVDQRETTTGDDGRDGTHTGAVGDTLLAAEPVRTPEAFIWQGRLYVVRRVLEHWRERRSWWRDALDPVPGRPTGIDVASREQHIWRVEASRGLAYGTGVFDLSSDGAPGAEADWRLVGVSD